MNFSGEDVKNKLKIKNLDDLLIYIMNQNKEIWIKGINGKV